MMVRDDDMTFEFDFGMDEYRGYVVARDSRPVRLICAAMGVGFLLMLPSALPARTSGEMVVAGGMGVIALLFLLGGAFGRLPWFWATRRSQAVAYLARHGATSGQPSFRQRVALAEDGVTVTYGPQSTWPDGVRTVKKPWSECQRATATRDGLLIECRTGQGGCLTALLGYNMLLRMAERDGYQDVFIPVSAFDGASAKKLAQWAQARIKSAR